MPDRNLDRRNDARLLTPLLLMALLIVCSFLYFAYVTPTPGA